MRTSASTLLLLYAISITAAVGLQPGVAAGKSLRLSTSSQVAEAYGKAVVTEFEKMTGIRTQTYVGPTETALKRLLTGASDIATIDRPLPEDAKQKGFIQIPFCRDDLAIITNPQWSETEASNVDNLTDKQVRAIFSGRITNWKALGGPDQRIIVFIPGENTGAYQNFKAAAMGLNEMKYHFIAYDSTIAIEAVKHIHGAISFVAQGAIADVDAIKVININDMSPRDKDYPFYQTFSFVTKGAPAGNAKTAINFGLSDWGIKIMRERGMTPIIN